MVLVFGTFCTLAYVAFNLYQCCFYKLLGFVSMCFVGFYGLYHTYAAFMLCSLVLLAKCYAFSLSTLTLVP